MTSARTMGLSSILLKGALDLNSTLYSGQAFRWRRDGDAHVGLVDNVPLRVWAENGRLAWQAPQPIHEARLRHYFRLDESHDAFLRGAPPEPLLTNAIDMFPGLRLLRQDPWEMLVSFVISQNSNEAKIRSTIEKLARIAGKPIEFEHETFYAFPTAASLAALDEATLRSTGMGYRAKYVHATAERVAKGMLRPQELPRMAYEVGFDVLLQVPGIGEKVADCVLLYGCDHLQAFPTDVWVRRLVHESYYRPRKAATHERLREFAWKRFGLTAGYAQHYLFHYRRVVGRLDAKAE
jgi:N-glycosylase/DNA lyase